MADKGLLGQYAGFVTRAIGLILDVSIVIIVMFVVYFAVSVPLKFFLNIDVNNCPAVTGSVAPSSLALLCKTADLVRAALALALAPLYFVFFWDLGGQTPGQYVMGVRVVRVDGKKMNLVRSLLRYVGYYISFLALGLGYFWVLWDDRRQGFHDKLAGTVVIYAWKARQNEFRLDKIGQFFRRRKTPAPPEPQQPGNPPALGNYPLALILVIFQNYELMRKILNLLQDAIQTGLLKITNATVLVKDDDGDISILGVSDLAAGEQEIPALTASGAWLPEVEVQQIEADIPNGSFAVAVILEVKWAQRAQRVIEPLGVDCRRYVLGSRGQPALYQPLKPAEVGAPARAPELGSAGQ